MPRIVLTVSIVAVSIVSFYFISTTSNVLLLSSYLSKITSKQRTLCSQIINSMAADNLGGKLKGAPLEKTLKDFVNSEVSFSKTDSVLNARLGKHTLSPEYKNLYDAYDSLMNSISMNLESGNSDYFVNLLTAENYYLKALDKYVSDLNSYSNSEVQGFKMKEISILLVSLLLVLLEITWLFLPAVKKINKQNNELTVFSSELKESHKLLQSHVKELEEKNELLKKIAHIQSHDVRQPLTSIMALVALIKEGYTVDDNWLKMMYDATASLDMRIQAIVHESRLNKELIVIRYNKMIEEIEEYAIVLLDADGKIENWNKGAEKVLGYKSYEAIGKNFSLFYTEADKKTSHSYFLLDQASQNGFARDEGWQVKEDGTKFWASTLITAIHNEENEIIGYTSVIRDMTDEEKNQNDRTALAG